MKEEKREREGEAESGSVAETGIFSLASDPLHKGEKEQREGGRRVRGEEDKRCNEEEEKKKNWMEGGSRAGTKMNKRVEDTMTPEAEVDITETCPQRRVHRDVSTETCPQRRVHRDVSTETCPQRPFLRAEWSSSV
ncbi:unnamed protein product [Pleuronectes platessa]|uniref:Uncharacterized protein n=1 Tax=Pleuronectes platessa TaxID=8262 RepID=A0A9N7YRP9_PLEPL|nr:unnamed protein product [Pleuronectes platessa]